MRFCLLQIQSLINLYQGFVKIKLITLIVILGFHRSAKNPYSIRAHRPRTDFRRQYWRYVPAYEGGLGPGRLWDSDQSDKLTIWFLARKWWKHVQSQLYSGESRWKLPHKCAWTKPQPEKWHVVHREQQSVYSWFCDPGEQHRLRFIAKRDSRLKLRKSRRY